MPSPDLFAGWRDWLVALDLGPRGQAVAEDDLKGALVRDLELARVDAEAGTVTVTLPNTILFSSGKATLKNATITELDHIQSVLDQQYSGREIDIVGHTDSDPIKKSKWKDNLELSAQRALTVTRYLIKRGISEANIRAVGCGASRSIASNASTSGKARNRRVEIVVNMR